MMYPSRSREGAWIEILLLRHLPRPNDVAPARERGLKLESVENPDFPWHRRSREGAWIEIYKISKAMRTARRRSREGAWIEIAW